jgi:hypothetical protein
MTSRMKRMTGSNKKVRFTESELVAELEQQGFWCKTYDRYTETNAEPVNIRTAMAKLQKEKGGSFDDLL